MNIAVTGSTGFIGYNLCNYLCDKNYTVYPIVRSKKKRDCFPANSFNVRVGDITDKESLRRVFREVDVVIHLAALFNNPEFSWEDYKKTNVLGTQNILEIAKECSIKRVIHCSTVGVATGAGELPYSENTPYSPPSWDKYETTKCDGEKLAVDFCKQNGFPVVIIRPGQVYGPGDKSKLKFYRMVKKGIIVNPGETLKHLIYIEDLCKAFELAILNKRIAGEVFIIAGDQPIPLKELIRIAANELGVSSPKIVVPATPVVILCSITEFLCNLLKIKPILFRRSMDFFTKSVAFDTTKARTVMNFSSDVEVANGVSKTVKWYKDQGLI